MTCAVKLSKYSSQLFQVARFLQEWAERSRFLSKRLPGQNILVTQMRSVKDSLPLGDIWVSITKCRTLPQGAWIHCNYSSTVGLWGRGTMYPHQWEFFWWHPENHPFGNPWRVQVCNRTLHISDARSPKTTPTAVRCELLTNTQVCWAAQVQANHM